MGEFVRARCPVCPPDRPTIFETDLGRGFIVRSSPRRSRYIRHLDALHPALSKRVRSLIADDMVFDEVRFVRD